MIEWVIFIVVCVGYAYYIYRVNGGKSFREWNILKSNSRLKEDIVVPKTVDKTVFYYWIGVLNRLVHYSTMRYYIFVDNLPLLKDTEEEILYCLMDKKINATEEIPFFRTYIVTGGLYKEIDIRKYR